MKNKKKHICGEKYCHICFRYHDAADGCYIQPIDDESEKIPPKRIIIFDFEVCFLKLETFFVSNKEILDMQRCNIQRRRSKT